MDLLIRDLLEYSRVVHGGFEFHPSVDSREAVDSALLNLGDTVEKSRARIEVDELPQVHADPVRLAQVFQNLIGNSLKYIDGRRPHVRIKAVLDGPEWLFSVADNGIGFESEYASRIFGLFRRLHRDRYPGTGVGLAICKRIVEEHGGRIWAEGALGRGATFYFTLPSDSAAEDDEMGVKSAEAS